jgi:outer membrane protein OmpA-like peptidoglycan-associated protein
MKKLLFFGLIAISTIFSTSCLAQNKAKKPLSAEAYNKIEQKARKSLADKDPVKQLIGKWQLAELFADKNATQYNADSAWHYIAKIDAPFNKIKSEIREKAEKKADLSASAFKKAKDAAAKDLFTAARKKGTLEGYQYALATTAQLKEYNLKKSRDSLKGFYAKAVIKVADTLQSAEAIKAFRTEYALFFKENKVQSARFDEKQFSFYFAKQGYADVEAFKQAYPDNLLPKDTAFVNFVKTMKLHDIKAYELFLKNHTTRTIFNEIVSDSVAVRDIAKVVETGTIKDWVRIVVKYPNTRYLAVLDTKISDYLLKMPQITAFLDLSTKIDFKNLPKTAAVVYPIYANDGRENRLLAYADIFKNYPDTAVFNLDMRLSQTVKQLRFDLDKVKYDSTSFAIYDQYIKAAAPKWTAFVALQKMIRRDIDAKNWAKAAQTVRNYEPYFTKNPKHITGLLKVLETPLIEGIKVDNIGDKINTKDKYEFVPLITIDAKRLYFCRMDQGNEDVFAATASDKGGWNFAYALPNLSKAGVNEAPFSISADGTSLIMFRDGKLSETHKTIGGWSDPQEMSSNINSAEWQGVATISPNNKVLIYESQRSEVLGYDPYVHGFQTNYENIDLFISFRDSLGNWSKGINIGTDINTFQTERSPYLHPDTKTLYFSSEGRGGLGCKDVFKTTRLDDTWLHWSEPVNIGKEINTGGDDWGYIVTSSSIIGYFAADGDIQYITPLPKLAKANDVVVVKGKLTDNKGKISTTGKVIVRDMETGLTYMECNVDPDSGTYQMALPPNGRYALEFVKPNTMPQFDTIDTRNVTRYIERTVETRKIVDLTEMKEKGIALPLNNLFFNYKEAYIRPDSYFELNNLAKLIQQNKWQVEISGHTDNQGSADTNRKLSEERARAVKTYLVEKGCDTNAITTIGLGATKPLFPNTDEAGRAKNRRVEIKIR